MEIYANYWKSVTGNSCSLIDFFARQKMIGGYLTRRFMNGRSYYPYVLTEAGSVFILNADKPDKAPAALKSLGQSGLPLPKDIISSFKNKNEGWRQCPFVPENGYGEIAINLQWHWLNSFNPSNGGNK